MGVTLDRHPTELDGFRVTVATEPETICALPIPILVSVPALFWQCHTKKSGEYYLLAIHNLMMPVFGTWRGLKRIAGEAYGPYKVLNTVKVTHMSAAQFATLIEAIDDFAPLRTPMYQCSWCASLFLSVIRDETFSKEYLGQDRSAGQVI